MARRSSRQLCRTERKKVIHCLAEHLRDVDRAHRGPRLSLQLIVWGWNVEFLPEDSLCLVRLFGEEGYFLCEETCTGAPPYGYRIVVN
jgi:hypothetical protein